MKGSFYANPLLPEGKESPLDGLEGRGAGEDNDGGQGGGGGGGSGGGEAACALARFPSVCRRNVWPKDPAVLPDLRPAFLETGRILADVAIAVAGACDAMLAAKERREGSENDGGGGIAKEAAATTTEAITTSTTTTTTATLRSMIESGDAAKGRLLYYYPPGHRSDSVCGDGEEGKEDEEEGGRGGADRDAAAAAAGGGSSNEEVEEEEEGAQLEEDEEDNWCGWHVDSGALTALVRAMFLDSEGKEVPSPDERAGLYVRPRRGWKHRRSSTRGGEMEQEQGHAADDEQQQQQSEAPLVRVSIPEGCVAVQAGEAAQVFSGGAIVATPHCVRGAAKSKAKKTDAAESENGVSRATFALFMQPRWDAPLEPFVAAVGEGEKGSSLVHTPESVGVARWRPGDTFGDFTERTFDAYYK